MPRAHVIMHRLATKELRAAILWHARRSLRSALALQDLVEQALETVATHPELGAVYEANVRWLRLGRYPYLFIYELRAGGRIDVLAISHGRRRPGYWRRRSFS